MRQKLQTLIFTLEFSKDNISPVQYYVLPFLSRFASFKLHEYNRRRREFF